MTEAPPRTHELKKGNKPTLLSKYVQLSNIFESFLPIQRPIKSGILFNSGILVVAFSSITTSNLCFKFSATTNPAVPPPTITIFFCSFEWPTSLKLTQEHRDGQHRANTRG